MPRQALNLACIQPRLRQYKIRAFPAFFSFYLCFRMYTFATLLRTDLWITTWNWITIWLFSLGLMTRTRISILIFCLFLTWTCSTDFDSLTSTSSCFTDFDSLTWTCYTDFDSRLTDKTCITMEVAHGLNQHVFFRFGR